jgi:hypothetical protein
LRTRADIPTSSRGKNEWSKERASTSLCSKQTLYAQHTDNLIKSRGQTSRTRVNPTTRCRTQIQRHTACSHSPGQCGFRITVLHLLGRMGDVGENQYMFRLIRRRQSALSTARQQLLESSPKQYKIQNTNALVTQVKSATSC